MKKKIIGFLCLLIIVVSVGCGSGKKIADNDSFIYGINSDGTALEKLPYAPKETKTNKAIDEMIRELKKEPEDIKYIAAIPKEIKVLNFEVQEKQLKLNFNEAYANLNNIQEVLVRAAVVQSLVEVEGIDFVAFYVEEVPLTTKAGNPVGLMKKDDFVKNMKTSANSYQAKTFTLYFANKAGDKLVKEMVNVRYSNNLSMEKLIIEQLMKGPSAKNANPVIPKDAKLIGVSVKNGICYVNFDKEFLVGGYDLKPKIPIYAIVNSLTEGTNISQVQISINGESDVVYLGEVDLKKPFERNLELIEEEKTE